jgi:DNA mismatch repair protein MLH1
MEGGNDLSLSTSRGIKQTSDEEAAHTPPRIRPLAQDVVNKIAAGEIIVAPVHALKELIENAVDAGSTQLEIVVKDGGLKLLQITDNGCGINKDDMSILCERFTTSKLKAFEDLTSICTYGFRGEALASISHIAHLSVTTRTVDSSCAFKAHYSDGKLISPKPNQSSEPKPAAGRIGTQITVEDLFYNIPNRRKAFRSASEEYNKILDLVGRYAIHCATVAFSCKKHGEPGVGLSISVNANTLDRIRQIHGSPVANELTELEIESTKWGFKANGWISNANYSVKKTCFILFINHRSVESSAIKKALEQMYANFLPKGGHPFIYISLEIEPHRVDVNVHPTKREVNFLHQDEVIETLCSEARAKLGTIDTSRTFLTQTLLPNVRIQSSRSAAIDTPSPKIPRTPGSNLIPYPSTGKRPIRQDNDLIRTDSRARKITTMLDLGSRQITSRLDDLEYQVNDKEPVICKLHSIIELRTEIRDSMHNELTDIFATHTFVGIVDTRRRIVAIQGGVKLYLVDYGLVCNEYFYQLGLTDFNNFGSIKFTNPLSLHTLLTIGADFEKRQTPPADALGVDWDEVVTRIHKCLIDQRRMLGECFSIDISENGDLNGIPLLIKGYIPSLAKLPAFLLRLGPFVDWETEKPCFRAILRELASFYVPEVVSPAPSAQDQTSEEAMDVDEDDAITKRRAHIEKAVENVLFPAFKSRLVATKGLLPGVTEIANLKGLYRVFERC